MHRYLLSDGWTHIFSEDGVERERLTRFAFDIETQTLPIMDVMRDNKWREADAVERADLLDSLVNANSEAILAPAEWDMTTSDQLPDWD